MLPQPQPRITVARIPLAHPDKLALQPHSQSGNLTNSIAEMKNPREYKKPIALAMGLLNVLYIVFSLVIYKYCGSESNVLNPSFTSFPHY
jgi:hypothetical protein